MSTPNPDATHDERVFVSYSHDSPAHRERVLTLTMRLRSEGVNVWIDRYDPHPPEGWPQWMRRQIREATHVMIVCTETYKRRVDLNEKPGRGLGATWESGLIILAAYADQGQLHKFVPIVFSPKDSAFIPDFLQGLTTYDVSTEDGYTELYARLTGQQLVPIPPLGPRRQVGVTAQPRDVGLNTPAAPVAAAQATAATELVLMRANGGALIAAAHSIREQGNQIEITVAPRDAEESAFLGELKPTLNPRQIWLAFGNTAYEATVTAADRSRDSSGEQWLLTMSLTDRPNTNLFEMGTTGTSADEVAELRARRILLDERSRPNRGGNDILEILVQGMGRNENLTASPIPPLYAELGPDNPLFLPAARLVAVLALVSRGIVEHVLELDLRLEQPNRVRVHFRGRRRKIYTNLAAHEITVDGVCSLSDE